MLDPYHIIGHLPTQNTEFQFPSWHSVENNPLGFWTLYLRGDSQSSKTTFQTARNLSCCFDDFSIVRLVAESQSHHGSAPSWLSDPWPGP